MPSECTSPSRRRRTTLTPRSVKEEFKQRALIYLRGSGRDETTLFGYVNTKAPERTSARRPPCLAPTAYLLSVAPPMQHARVVPYLPP